MPDYVIKSNGQKEVYNPEKIKNSLKAINLSEEKINEILLQIEKKLPSVVRTKEIFKFIYSYLGKQEPHLAFRFNLKQAIFKLGPTGYPFEKFVAHLLKLHGYKAHHNLFLQGKCLIYEIDFLAEKEDILYVGECKFHQKQNQKSDVKTALYVYARFLDIKDNLNKKALPMIVTNTRFTSEVIDYAKCYDLKLISWDYPKENLPFLIEEKKAYPLTIFDFLPLRSLQDLFNYDIVLITDFLSKDLHYLKKISNLDDKSIQKINEISKLLVEE